MNLDDNYYIYTLIKNKFKMKHLKEVLQNKGINKSGGRPNGQIYTSASEYARNKRQPSLEDLYKLADVLNIDTSELLVKKKKENEDT